LELWVYEYKFRIKGMSILLKNLWKHICEKDIKILLIGGYALCAYGVFRQTLDIDLMSTDDDIAEIKEIMNNLGYKVFEQTENFIRFIHEAKAGVDIDILLVDLETFITLNNEAKTCDIMGERWRVPCPIHLIALKLHAIKNNTRREPRDIADIIELIRSPKTNISESEIEVVCQKYGPEGIYNRIRKYLI